MGALIVVITYPSVNPLPEFFDIICWKEIDILLLDGSPEAFYPYIVFASSSTIHGYLNYLSGRRLSGGQVYHYINYLNYDAYRRPVRCISGNDYTTDYTYDMDRQWLSGMQTYSSQHDLQDVFIVMMLSAISL